MRSASPAHHCPLEQQALPAPAPQAWPGPTNLSQFRVGGGVGPGGLLPPPVPPVIWMSAPGVHEMSTEPSSTLDNKLVHILKATSVSGGPATPSYISHHYFS